MNNNDGCHFPPTAAAVGVIMGSKNDWETMRTACEVLEELGIVYEKTVVSAHRTPRRMIAYANGAESRGLKVIIAGAGGAAHLPGMIASETPLPVIGVPIKSRTLNGLDSLLSIVQMPAGIPVATMAIGESGARNAGIFAARILSLTDGELAASVKAFIDKQTAEVLANTELE
ncbi:MAG: 5-(carboxyamino)imidazole ribonucleotide mutase [Planctomycetota bacterium]